MKADQWIEIFRIAERYLGDADKATWPASEIEEMLNEHLDAMEE